MNKKIFVMGLLAVFMLVSISFVSSAEESQDVERKESPLWRIRTKQAISEKISNIVENIKTKLLGERAFFLPLQGFLTIRYCSHDHLTQDLRCTYMKQLGCNFQYITTELDCHK